MDPIAVLNNKSIEDWKVRLYAVSKLCEVANRDQVARALAVEIQNPRSKLASEALEVSKQLAGGLGVGPGAAVLLDALLKVASNLRVKGTRDQAADAMLTTRQTQCTTVCST